MDIEIIEQIAQETRMDMCMYGGPDLIDTGKGTLRFTKSSKLTYYGENLVVFANAVEKYVINQG